MLFKSSTFSFSQPLTTTSNTKSNDLSITSSQETEKTTKSPECPSLPLTPTCTKNPPSLANALIHYATTNITPQQTIQEISVSAKILQKKITLQLFSFWIRP
jgi:glucuronoxylan 4-O-methyltransferase